MTIWIIVQDQCSLNCNSETPNKCFILALPLFLANKLQLLEQCTSYLNQITPKTLRWHLGIEFSVGSLPTLSLTDAPSKKTGSIPPARLVWLWDMGWELGFLGKGRRQRK